METEDGALRQGMRRFHEYRKKKSVQNLSWMMFGQGFGYLCQAAYFILLTRLLGSLQYGIFVGAFAFTSLVAPYSSLGMGTVYLRYVSGDGKNGAAYWGNLLMASVAISGVLIAGLTITGKHFLNPQSAQLVFLAAVSNCLCAQLVTECSRIYQAAERMHVTALLSLLSNATRALTVAGMLLILHHSTAYQWTVASVIVSATAALIAVGSVLYSFGAPQFRPGLLRQRATEGLGFSFATSASSFYNDVDKTMLSHYGMNEDNGIYTTAYRVIDFATMPILALRDSMMPKLFAAGRSGINEASKIGQKLLLRSVAFSLVMFAFLVAVAPLLTYAVGKSFAESVSAVRWLAFIPVLRSMHQMSGSSLLVSGYQRFRTANQLAAATFNLGVNFWLIPRYGWHGAAWSSLATDGLLALLNGVTLKMLERKEIKTRGAERIA